MRAQSSDEDDEYSGSSEKWYQRTAFRVLVVVLIIILISSGVASVMAWRFVSKTISTLPPVESLLQYEQIVPSSVYSKDDFKIGEIFVEKRYPLTIKEINPLLIDAVLSAEDARYYSHSGVDYRGTFRAALHWLFKMGQKQGGSSITQQLAKMLLLTRDRTIERKIKDMALAMQMEKVLGKDKILELYLNTIFLGNNSYGVEAAARNYFRKSNRDLTLAECAIIAGLAPAPSAYSPIEDIKKAKKRQKFVLEQMYKNKKITHEAANEAYAVPLKVFRAETPNAKAAPYFFAEVKKQLEKIIPVGDLATKGYKIYTTVDLRLQQSIQTAVTNSLIDFQEKKSFRGVIAKHGEDWSQAVQKIIEAPVDENSAQHAIVVDILPKLNTIVLLSAQGIHMLLEEDHRWVFNSQPEKDGEAMTFQNFLAIGDEVNIRDLEKNLPKRLERSQMLTGKIEEYAKYFSSEQDKTSVKIAALADADAIEASALIANASTGEVLAVVGGSSFEQSQFNRATQAKRQVGSSVKPFYYAFAQDEGFSPASLLDSPPIVIGDWRPENYSKEFQGRTTLRRALINSYNIASIQLMQAIGLRKTTEIFAKMGFDWDEKIGGFALALGAGSATLLQMVQAYTAFANEGKITELAYISKIIDRKGEVIYSLDKTPDILKVAKINIKAPAEDKKQLKATPDNPYWQYSSENPLQVFSPEAAFVTTKLLQDVINFGTGTKAAGVSPDAAGKTGTTNNYTDAWFMGVLPNVVGGVWVGFDDSNKSLGPGSTGGKMAAPIWKMIMSKYVELYKPNKWNEPKNIDWIRIDPDTGALLPSRGGGVLVPAIKDTEPGGIRARNALGVLGLEGQNNVSGVDDGTSDDSSQLRYSN